MKNILLFAVIAMILSCRPAAAQDTSNPTNELKALLTKVNTDIRSGKSTEADFSDDLKQFDAVLAEHKGEKTQIMAEILYMKARLYSEVIGDTDKADAVIKQLTNDFSNTPLAAAIMKQEAQEAHAKEIQATLVSGTPFPDFSEKDVMGQPLSLAQYKGKVVLVDFWATWCGPCRAELPNVIETYQKNHDKGFDIIGISLDQNQQALLQFIKDNNMPWQQYFDGQGWSNKLAVKYGIEAIPMTFLLDKDGKIIGKNLRGPELADAVAAAVSK